MKLPQWLFRLRNAPVHALARLMIWFSRVLPEDQAYQLGAVLGTLAYRSMPRWRRTALRNIELIYSHQPAHCRPDLEEAEYLAEDSARHLAWEVVEFMRMGVLPPWKGLEMVVAEQGAEHLQQVLARGKGAIVIGMHYGNWELTGAFIASRIAPLYAVGKAQRDEFFTRLAFPWRSKFGIRNIFAGKQQGSLLLRALHENAILGLISDQNGGKNGTFAPLCGIPASCVTGAAQLALKLGTPLLPVYSIRLQPGRHCWVCQPPISVEGLPADPQQRLAELLTRINARIESVVLVDPSQWLLGHKRWKTRPPGQPALYTNGRGL